MTEAEMAAQYEAFLADFAYQLWGFPYYIERTILEAMENPVCNVILAMVFTYAAAVILRRMIRIGRY